MIKYDLNHIQAKQKKEATKKRSKEQKKTLYNIEMLCKSRNEAMKIFDDYSLMVSQAKNKAKNKTSGK